MGLFEVLRHLPRLLRLRASIVERFLRDPPDAFIGIDAPDFTLGIERRLKARGVPTVHYVSPSVWVWRAGRVKDIAAAADRVLCLLPFEPAHYAGSGTEAVFVGHPAADALAPVADPRPARRALGLAEEGELIAVLPGSRGGEVGRLGPRFAGAIARIHAARPATRFVAPMVSEALDARFAGLLAAHAPGVPVTRIRGRSREVLAACDAAVVASGTATLETMLLARPMVVGYRLAPLTDWILFTFGFIKVPRFALPNIVAGEEIVPELMRSECTAERLADAMLRLLTDDALRARQVVALRAQRAALAVGADQRAAAAVAGLLAERGRG
jgi:lipid-A-disaccharide synthase